MKYLLLKICLLTCSFVAVIYLMNQLRPGGKANLANNRAAKIIYNVNPSAACSGKGKDDMVIKKGCTKRVAPAN